MGCPGYDFYKFIIRFEEMNDDVSCLCSFPLNSLCEGGKIDRKQMRSLAMLGANIAILGYLAENDLKTTDRDYYKQPQKLPDWIISEIKRHLPDE